MAASANSASSSIAQKGGDTVVCCSLQALPQKPRKRARDCIDTKWPASVRAKRRALSATLLEEIVITPFEETDKLEKLPEIVVEWSPPLEATDTLEAPLEVVVAWSPPTSPTYDYESCMVRRTFDC